jgi:hypothetical protein
MVPHRVEGPKSCAQDRAIRILGHQTLALVLNRKGICIGLGTTSLLTASVLRVNLAILVLRILWGTTICNDVYMVLYAPHLSLELDDLCRIDERGPDLPVSRCCVRDRGLTANAVSGELRGVPPWIGGARG